MPGAERVSISWSPGVSLGLCQGFLWGFESVCEAVVEASGSSKAAGVRKG